MTRQELFHLGSKLKTSARGTLLDYIEGTLPLLTTVFPPRADYPKLECSICVKRRKQKADAQKRWRKSQKISAKF